MCQIASCHTVLYPTMPYHAIPCHTMPYHTRSKSTPPSYYSIYKIKRACGANVKHIQKQKTLHPTFTLVIHYNDIVR